MNVLLVEDEALVAMDTQDALEELGCVVIGWATTGPDAERLALDYPPDLILMDVRLKGREDGIAAAGRLRATVNAPIIFISGAIDAETRERIQAMPATAVIQKPYHLTELRNALTWARGLAAP